MARRQVAARELVRVERELLQAEEVLAVAEDELTTTTGTERRDLAKEIGQRKRYLSQLRARRSELRQKAGDHQLAKPKPQTETQRMEDLAELVVAALFGLPVKKVRKMIAEADQQQDKEHRWVERERYREQVAEYVCRSTDSMAKYGRWP